MHFIDFKRAKQAAENAGWATARAECNPDDLDEVEVQLAAARLREDPRLLSPFNKPEQWAVKAHRTTIVPDTLLPRRHIRWSGLYGEPSGVSTFDGVRVLDQWPPIPHRYGGIL